MGAARWNGMAWPARRVTAAAWLALVALAGVLGACGGGGGGLRPKELGASEAIGEAFQCTPDKLKGDLTPFTVDWSDGERTALESAMRKGVAVVAMTCKGPKVLRACQLGGDYRYNGVSRKSKLVQMKDLLSAAANFGGVMSTAAFRGELKRGRSLNLAYVLVGNQSTSVSEVSPVQLTGRCEGATHFVFEAQLGAFVLETAEAGKANASVESLFGSARASGESAKSTRTTDGDPARCEAASRTDAEPVDGCSALMRVELMAIRGGTPGPGGGVGGATGTAAGAIGVEAAGLESVRGASAKTALGCPAGLVFLDGVCVTPAPDQPRLCGYDDLADCAAQCRRGSIESCDRWGFIKLQAWEAIRLKHGFWDETVPEQIQYSRVDAWGADIHAWAGTVLAEAETMLVPACNQDFKAACGALGIAYYSRWQGRTETDWETSKALRDAMKQPLLRGCALGDLFSCMGLYRKPNDLFTEEEERDAYASACAQGNGEICGLRADMVMRERILDDSGKIVAAVAPEVAGRMLGYLERACYGGHRDTCPLAAGLLVDDVEVCGAIRRGGALRPRGFSQYVYGEAYPGQKDADCDSYYGPYIKEDRSRARDLLKSGCVGGHALSCDKLKTFFPESR